MYVAVKGGERAIDNAHQWLAEERRGDPAIPELTIPQIREQMALAVNRVMAEGSLYDPDLAALVADGLEGQLDPDPEANVATIRAAFARALAAAKIETEVDELLICLQAQGYLNEARFVESRVHARARACARIARKLQALDFLSLPQVCCGV